MNDDDYMDWYNEHFQDNAIAFAEKHESDFDDWCLEKYMQLGQDIDDYIYERARDDVD